MMMYLNMRHENECGCRRRAVEQGHHLIFLPRITTAPNSTAVL